MATERIYRIKERKPDLQIAREALVVPEITLTPGYKAIGVFGRNGAGNSSLGEELAEVLGPNAEFYDAGQDVRESTGNEPTKIGFMKRSLKLDRELDSKQVQDILYATTKNPIVMASKLSGYLMKDTPGTYRILVTAPRKTAIARIRKRAMEKLDEAESMLYVQLRNTEISEEEFEQEANKIMARRDLLTIPNVLREERERESKDFEHWSKVHSPLKGVDIYSPGARVNGEKLYDYTISTKSKTKQQTLQAVVNHLIEAGIAKPR